MFFIRNSGKKKRASTPEALAAVHKFKFETASELGEIPRYHTEHWGNIFARELENPSGHPIRAMIAQAEQDLQNSEGGFK